MYKTSEQINELLTALSKAQAKIENASKNSSNPHFKSKYADLASVLNSLKEPLGDNGLAVIQTLDETDNRIYLTTTLGHASGQFVQTRMPLFLGKQDMQGLGSAVSYARRYSLSALLGISQEDDDGELNRKEIEAQKKAEKEEEDRIPSQIFYYPNGFDEHLIEQYLEIVASTQGWTLPQTRSRAASNMSGFLADFKKWQQKQKVEIAI